MKTISSQTGGPDDDLKVPRVQRVLLRLTPKPHQNEAIDAAVS